MSCIHIVYIVYNNVILLLRSSYITSLLDFWPVHNRNPILKIHAVEIYYLFQNWQGNPYTGCRAECTYDSDCPRGKPVCYYSKCVNPCEGACGVSANCELRGTTPVCSCPRDMTGDPFVSCRPFTPSMFFKTCI